MTQCWKCDGDHLATNCPKYPGFNYPPDRIPPHKRLKEATANVVDNSTPKAAATDDVVEPRQLDNAQPDRDRRTRRDHLPGNGVSQPAAEHEHDDLPVIPPKEALHADMDGGTVQADISNKRKAKLLAPAGHCEFCDARRAHSVAAMQAYRAGKKRKASSHVEGGAEP